MAKKLDAREYEAELIKVLDGDTIDCYIDLDLILRLRREFDIWVSILGNQEQEI